MQGDPQPQAFPRRADEALHNPRLRQALRGLDSGLVAQRARAIQALPEFEKLRDEARDIRDHSLNNLERLLVRFEANALAIGTKVHWAATAADARKIVADICKSAGAKLIAKGKSMVSEEIGLNRHLETAGHEVIETDLGEYLMQIRDEAPSHILAPAIHLTPQDVARDFHRVHGSLDKDRVLETPAQMVDEARQILRKKFLAADVGITGANFLVAETGSAVLVTNEGNGDLTQNLPDTLIILASIEKVVATLADVAALMRVLVRSATGQEVSAYTTLQSGPRRESEPDGPQAVHVVLLDNGRSQLLRSEFREVLRCIRCAACMNHCPVYTAVGGHAYGWVYPGPIGAVLTPALLGIEAAGHLPNASTFCGKCESVCPVKIPLPNLMRRWREQHYIKALPGVRQRMALRVWAFLATRPRLYKPVMRLLVAGLGAAGRKRGRFRWLPLASSWTAARDFPAPEGRTFEQLWKETKRGVPR